VTRAERIASRLYQQLARAFPHEYRVVCGDGLERLGQDMVPLVWQSDGFVGVIRLFGDLLWRLPYEHCAALIGKPKEWLMNGDVFEGTWQAVNDKTKWDPKYTPEQACMRFEKTDTGYLLVAYGVKDGQAVAERPTAIIADGRKRPIVDLNGRPIAGVPPGAMQFGRQPDSHTLEAGAEVDGKSIGQGTYHVSADGKTLTVTTEGMGLKGPFKVSAVFERVVPDPYQPS
jgi:hypothetical protein